jgi:uncharacterized membrane protein YfcA
LAAGTINTVVGSGTLVTFPTLLALGYSPLVANVSNTIGLVFGNLSGIHAYRRELSGSLQRRRAVQLGVFTLVGSVAGSFLLLELPGSAFRKVIPFLILAACALVAVQPRLSRWLGKAEAATRLGATGTEASTRGAAAGADGELPGLEHSVVAGRRGRALAATVLATGVYGGYFGAAQGVVLISLLAIFIDEHIQRLNALKNVLVMISNLSAGVIFAFSGHVSWGAAGLLAIGAVAGGQIGGRLGRRLPPPLLRAAVVVVGTVAAVLLLV